MAQREFSAARELMPRLLQVLCRARGDARPLGPLWKEAAGPEIGKRAVPTALHGHTLVLEAVGERWVHELQRLSPVLLARVREQAGELDIQALEFRAPRRL